MSFSVLLTLVKAFVRRVSQEFISLHDSVNHQEAYLLLMKVTKVRMLNVDAKDLS